MENVNRGVEERKEGAPQGNQYGIDSQNHTETQIEQITHILNNLFDPNNLANNAYLVHRAQGVTFHIPVRWVYEENSIKAITYDREIINHAIERAENVIANKKGDIIDTVKPARDQLQKNITVKGITRDEESEFEQLVKAYPEAQENILSLKHNPQLNATTIICKDEQFAIDLYNHLLTQQFKGSAINCVLNFESLYISALENMKRRSNKRPIEHQQNRPYMPNPYQMQPFFYNQMQPNGYNMRNFYQPQTPFYMPNPSMNQMNMGMNPNINGGNMPRPQNYYNRGGGNSGGRGGRGGGFNKRGRGGRGGGRYNKNNNYRQSDQPTQVEVNDSDFPPLSNENQEEQQ